MDVSFLEERYVSAEGGKIEGIEKRILKTIWGKSGTDSKTVKICLPISYMHFMGVTNKDREVEMIMDYGNNVIMIKKK